MKRSTAKIPVEKLITIWYHYTIVSLFIKEITDEQEK